MASSKLLSSLVALGAALASGVASAALTVNLNPQGNGVGTTAAFDTVGFSSQLTSMLTINANSGSGVAYVETGTINITNFLDATNPLLNAVSGVGTDYSLFGNFTLSGTGTWNASTFTADPSAMFSMDLYADPAAGFNPAIYLGTATLNPAAPAIAFAAAFGSVAPGSTGAALTSLSAFLNFTPAAGTTGLGNFFQAPNPFAINLAVGNAGGNALNTGYMVDAGGVVSFITPIPGTNPGTANVTFAAVVPEPGALALVGIALVGAAAARRKVAAKA